MTDNNGIFTVSDLAGTDPHSYWITGLPHAAQPHVWEQPQFDPWGQHDQLLRHQLLVDADCDRGLLYAGLNPYTLQPLYPEATAPAGPRQYNMDGLRSHWAFKHPVRAWLARTGLAAAPTDNELIRDWNS